MGENIKRLKVNFVIFFVLICIPVCASTNTSTVCYGSPGLSCATHRLSCTSPLVIQILNTSYGYRSECNDKYGLTNCVNTTCCKEEPGDCMVQLSSEDRRISGNCNGIHFCDVQGVRRYIKNDTICNGISSYSKIQYDCVPKVVTTNARKTEKRTTEAKQAEESTSDTQYITSTASTTKYRTISTVSTSSTTKDSKDRTVSSSFTSKDSTDRKVSTTQSSQWPVAQNEASGIVGGVLKSLSTIPQENNYDSITKTGRDQTLPTYDFLQVNSTASSDHVNKTKSDSSHTYYNTKGESLTRNIDPYYENMKRP
ncbi:hypothetical protein LOTGIDRAFT_229546 [Lottia gigantea]|uniref:SUEL-type lectin domain-containing protein n=1 Tax=Lottia gigantea TaxID=225164 RepID=V3ZIF6_LOTGI|nr:hypothetical protein LOTGIDRAFT_229546 [Lottia gigantea]ESO83992.1 hypothetical protein LOTGIDRAFT_229546 [Lottia gigantea]